MPTEPIAVIWDVDGTLVDTGGAALRGLGAAVPARWAGRSPATTSPPRSAGGTRRSSASCSARSSPTPRSLDIGERKETYYRAAAEAGVQLLPGVRELLDGLHARGVRQAVGSSAPRATST